MTNKEIKTREQLLIEVNQLETRISELEKSELQTRTWVENSPMCTKILDLDFNLQYMSSAGISALKIDDISKFYGKPYPLSFFPDSFKIPMCKNLQNVKETGETITQEASVLDLDGNKIWYHATLVPVNNYEGVLDHIMVVSLDITQRKLTELALRDSEERLSLALKDSLITVFMQDKDLVYTWVNNSNDELASVDIIGKKDKDLVAKEDADRLTEIKSEVLTTGKTHRSTVRFMINNTPYYYDLTVEANKNLNGDIIGIRGTSIDITEKKKADKELHESVERFKTVVTNSEGIVYIIDKDGTFSLSEGKGLSSLGLKPGEVVGKSVFELYKDYPGMLEEMRRVFKGETISSEVSISDTIQFKNWYTPQLSVNNEIIGLLGLSVDITEQKQAEEKIRTAEENLKRTFDLSPSIICKANVEAGYFIEANQAVTKILGYSVEEFTSKPILEFVHPDDRQKTIDEIDEELKGKEVTFFENRYLCKDGFYKWIAWNGSKADENGIVTAIGSDITERKEAEQSLKESEERYRTMIETSNDLIWMLDPSGNFMFINAQAEKATGYLLKDLKGKSFHPLAMEDELPFLMEVFMKSLSGESVTYEMKLKTIYGNVLTLAVNTAPLSAGGEVKTIFSFARDITHQKEIEKALVDSVSKQNEMISNISDVIAILDTKGTITYKSTNIKEIFGWKPEELIGKSSFETIHEDDKVRIQQEFNRLVKNKKDRTVIEYNYRCKDGTYKMIQCTASNLLNNPHINGILLNYHDISQQKEAERSLKESETRFKALHNASFGGIAIHDKGIIKDCNQGLSDISGYSMKELIGMDGLLCIAEDSRKLVMQNIQSSYEKAYEVVGLRKNGEEYPLRIEGKMIPFEGKEMRVVEFRDISEQKKAEDIVRRLSIAVEQSPSIIVIADIEGNLEYVNPKFTEITGYSSSELIGQKSNILKSGKQDSRFYKGLWETVLSGKVWRGQFHNKKKNGEMFWEAASISAIHNKSGEVINYIKIGEDITQQKNTETELKTALEKALESDRLKSAFLANMSHELRTPLNGILGFINLLTEPNLSSVQIDHYSSIINKSSDRLLNTINDIIDISKIEAGEMVISTNETSIDSLMKELYSFYSPEANQKGLSLFLETSPSAEETNIVTDSHKLHGILTNLIKNAIKYTEKGSISFGYLKEKNFIEFYVKDSGIGIPEDRIQAVFNRFEQADIEDRKGFQGSGLGLAISKAFAEMLGGEIYVESNEGKGSKFVFTIPYIQKEIRIIKESSKNIDNAPAKMKKFNLLIVEDEDVSSELLKMMLKGTFQKIITAQTGIEAIEICKNNKEIDLVLMDIKMPKMDGYEATQQIRKFNNDLVIIAQTAYAMFGDKKKAIEAGCNDYISKPINKKLLLEMIKKHLTTAL